MRFYDGAHRYLYDAMQRPDTLDQCLYLVPEISNTHDVNAVMLHNGKQKLGSVNAEDSAKIKRILVEWAAANGGARNEDVIVCRMQKIYNTDMTDFQHRGSIQVYGMHRVNERLARKFSDKQRNGVK